jgi:hypothetical protein
MNKNQVRTKIITLLLPIVMIGCGNTLKLYMGPELPQDKIAIFQLAPSLYTVSVDDVEIPDWYLDADLLMLPGHHTIELGFGTEKYYSEDTITISVEAEAGKQYYIESGWNLQSWNPYIRELEQYKQKTLIDHIYPYRPGRDYK